MSHHRKHHEDPREDALLEDILRTERAILYVVTPHLASIKVHIRSHTMTGPTVGPIVLTSAGAKAVASVIGYDQYGNVFTGTIPTPTLTASDTAGAIATFDPTTGDIAAVANGVDTISASVQTTDSAGNPVTLTDSETVTVNIPVTPPPPPPYLASIKVAFSQ